MLCFSGYVVSCMMYAFVSCLLFSLKLVSIDVLSARVHVLVEGNIISSYKGDDYRFYYQNMFCCGILGEKNVGFPVLYLAENIDRT